MLAGRMFAVHRPSHARRVHHDDDRNQRLRGQRTHPVNARAFAFPRQMRSPFRHHARIPFANVRRARPQHLARFEILKFEIAALRQCAFQRVQRLHSDHSVPLVSKDPQTAHQRFLLIEKIGKKHDQPFAAAGVNHRIQRFSDLGCAAGNGGRQQPDDVIRPDCPGRERGGSAAEMPLRRRKSPGASRDLRATRAIAAAALAAY